MMPFRNPIEPPVHDDRYSDRHNDVEYKEGWDHVLQGS